MKRIRRFGTAAALAGLLAGGLFVGVSPAEAARKGGGDSGASAQCTYLLNVITYPYVSPVIKLWAMSLYTSLGCQPPLP